MSCCGKNNGNFYTHPYNTGKCCTKDVCYDKCTQDSACGCQDNCCNEYCETDLTGISCPNNAYCCCDRSLRDAARKLINQRVVIYTAGCKMCVVIVNVGECFVKAINPCTQRIIYFNINRIDNIEDVLPRCN